MPNVSESLAFLLHATSRKGPAAYVHPSTVGGLPMWAYSSMNSLIELQLFLANSATGTRGEVATGSVMAGGCRIR